MNCGLRSARAWPRTGHPDSLGACGAADLGEMRAQ